MRSESLGSVSARWPAFLHLMERGLLPLLKASEASQNHTPLLGASFCTLLTSRRRPTRSHLAGMRWPALQAGMDRAGGQRANHEPCGPHGRCSHTHLKPASDFSKDVFDGHPGVFKMHRAS